MSPRWNARTGRYALHTLLVIPLSWIPSEASAQTRGKQRSDPAKAALSRTSTSGTARSQTTNGASASEPEALGARTSSTGPSEQNASLLDGYKGPTGPYGEQLTIDSKGLTLQFPDDVAKLRIGGRLQLDFGAARVRQRGFGAPFDDDFAVRRAWFEPHLSLKGGWEFALQYDFSNAQTPIYDALAAYTGLEPVIITVGNMKEPFFLDRLTNNNNLLFTERALPDAFNPSRSFGAAIGSNGDRWTLTGGVYGNNANEGIADNGIAGIARATFAPVLESGQVLHLGVAGSYRALDRSGPDLSFSSQPEAFLFSENKDLVDTDTIGAAATVRRVGLETVYQHGPVTVQAEYVHTDVDRFGGLPSLSFQGGYIQAGWILNGKGRAYKLKPDYGTTYAVFGGVEVGDSQRVVNGGVGVFELGARFSALDLQDRTTRGGVEQDATVGLNWYPDRNVKVMGDYVRAHARPSAQLDGRTVDTDIFIGRLQFYW